MSCGPLTSTENTHDELHRHWYVPAHTALSVAFGSGPRSGAHHCQPPRAGLEPALQWRRDLRRHRGATTGRCIHCAAPPHRRRRPRRGPECPTQMWKWTSLKRDEDLPVGDTGIEPVTSSVW